MSPGRFAALVHVDRHPSHLSVTAEGRVLRRQHGSTEPVADGAELTRLVRARSTTSPAAPLDPEAAPDELADAALAAIEHGREPRLRSFIADLTGRLPRAAQFSPRSELDSEMDRLSALVASLAQSAPESPVTTFALAAHHRVLAATDIRPIPGGRPDLDLSRTLLRNARAVGALLVRLELWSWCDNWSTTTPPTPRSTRGG